MSSSSQKDSGGIEVRSKFGPLRIELLDERLNRMALGFGTLRATVPAGLYTLQYSAGSERDEEIVRVEPNRTVKREIALPFAAVAPISVSTTTHEFHTRKAVQFSSQPLRDYGTGGGLMIFVRTIDADGRAPVPIDRLSLHNAQLEEVGNLAADAARDANEGWACFSVSVAPGGYALRWLHAHPDAGNKPQFVDQSLWVCAGWVTMVFIGYHSQAATLERQSASIHLARFGQGFNPGPDKERIRDNQVYEEELKVARINQALDLALVGLRTGNQVVPDDLLDLLLESKFQNPMLGIVGAHAILQRRTKDWKTFDLVIQNLEGLIPGHPDVAALKLARTSLSGEDGNAQPSEMSWPPMLSAGYRALIDSDWKAAGEIIEDNSVAERAAVALLPETPWTSWLAVDATPARRGTRGRRIGIDWQDLGGLIRLAADPDTPLGRTVRVLAALTKSPTTTFSNRVDDVLLTKVAAAVSHPAVTRVIRFIADLKEMDEDFDLSKLSLDDFRQLGLPVGAIEKALKALTPTLSLPDIGRFVAGLRSDLLPKRD